MTTTEATRADRILDLEQTGRYDEALRLLDEERLEMNHTYRALTGAYYRELSAKAQEARNRQTGIFPRLWQGAMGRTPKEQR